MNRQKNIRFIAEAGIIGALYVVFTMISTLFGMSSGVIQVRISEAFCVLCAFTPAAIPGLTIGCVISNILSGCAIFDIIFGSLATLIGAVVAYFISKMVMNKGFLPKCLIPLPNVVANTLIVPFVLRYVYGVPDAIWFMMVTVGIGEIISCFVLGMPLLYVLDKRKQSIFKR